MSVFGLIIGIILMAVLGYLIFRNVLGIIQGIKARKKAKLDKQLPNVSDVIDKEDYEKKE